MKQPTTPGSPALDAAALDTAAPKHTPGPWRVSRHHSEGVGAVNGRFIADCRVNADAALIPENEANARLIATAPELAGALLAASHALRSYQYGNASPALAKEIADAADELLAQAGWAAHAGGGDG